MRVETVAEQLYFTTVRLASRDGATASAATGFIYSVPTDKGDVVLLVSNKHVLSTALDELVISMIAGDADKPVYGTAATIDATQALATIVSHPDPRVDVAAMPLGPILNSLAATGPHPYFRSVAPSIAMTATTVDSLVAVEAVAFVGYPANLYDTANLTPILRRGSTATPVALDYQDMPAFLIDAAVFPGSSGSPVFILNQGSWAARQGGLVTGTRLIFLGVLAAVHARNVTAELTPIPTRVGVTFADPLNLGIVFKAPVVDKVADLVLENYGQLRRTEAASAAHADVSEAEQEITAAAEAEIDSESST